MKANALKCPNCSAPLEIEDGLDIFYCKYCGYKIMIEGQTDATINAKVHFKNMEHQEKMQDKKYSHERYKIEQKNKRLKSEKKENNIFYYNSACSLFVFSGIFCSVKLGSDNEEKKLQETVNEIMIDIKNEDYEDAYVKANSLHYTSGWSHDIEKKWDDTRKAIIDKLKKQKRNQIMMMVVFGIGLIKLLLTKKYNIFLSIG